MKVVFVLTYNEQDLWIKNYPIDTFKNTFSNYKFYIIDNGNQPGIKDWCNETGSYYYACDYNIGSTGGYNFIFRVADLLQLDRAVLTQGDVEIKNTVALDILFEDQWKENQIPFYPQVDKSLWDMHNGGQVYNLGQLFSFNPNFLLFENFINDENYVVTHYDDADLARRMRDSGRVDLINVLLDRFPEKDCLPDESGSHVVEDLYAIHHYSSLKQERSTNHQEWLEYNADYHMDKWKGDGMPAEEPWDRKEMLNNYRPHSHRWVALGYLPYPVEHEVNRFWKQHLSDSGIHPIR